MWRPREEPSGGTPVWNLRVAPPCGTSVWHPRVEPAYDWPSMSRALQQLERLAAARWRLSILITTLMTSVYVGFILLVAFNKPLMGQQITPGLSIGILLGVLVILAAWVLTGIYIVWANGKYDRALHQYRDRK